MENKEWRKSSVKPIKFVFKKLYLNFSQFQLMISGYKFLSSSLFFLLSIELNFKLKEDVIDLYPSLFHQFSFLLKKANFLRAKKIRWRSWKLSNYLSQKHIVKYQFHSKLSFPPIIFNLIDFFFKSSTFCNTTDYNTKKKKKIN